MDTISKDMLGLILVDGGYFSPTYYPILRMVCKRWKDFIDGIDLPHIKDIFEMCLEEDYDNLAMYLLKYKFKPKKESLKKIIKSKDIDIFKKVITRYPKLILNDYVRIMVYFGRERFLEYVIENDLFKYEALLLLTCCHIQNQQNFKKNIDILEKYKYKFVKNGHELYNPLIILYNPPHCDYLKYLLEKFGHLITFEKIYGKNLKGPDDIKFYKWLNSRQKLKKLIDYNSLIKVCLDKEYIEFLDWIASVKNLDLDRYKIKRDQDFVKMCIRNHKLHSLQWLLNNGFDVPPTFCILLLNHRILGRFIEIGGETCTCGGKHHRIVNSWRERKRRKII